MSFPKIEGYVVTEKLGSGSYSTVYKAYTKVGARQTVAVKSIDKEHVKHSGAAVDNLVSEIRMLKTLAHPHIVHMKHFLWDHKNIYIITEYCSGGDLSKYIHRYGRVPERRMLYFLQQLVSALQYLREKGVTHMDLKPHNLLLQKGSDGKYILKVADFGFAAYVSGAGGGARGVRGSPLYMAPEMFCAAAYDERVDLWSLGVIVYECLFGRAPHASATLRELAHKLRARLPIQIPDKPAISSGCRDLLSRLLRHEPAERISFPELFAHPYVDLQHAPTRDNFDKGVARMREAVALDARGQHAAACAEYGRALSLLVPQALHETDPDRKAALSAQLNRYMQRAEEVKDYLKYLQTGVPPAPPAVPPPAPTVLSAAPPASNVPPAPLATTEKPQPQHTRGGGAACCLSPTTLSLDVFDTSGPAPEETPEPAPEKTSEPAPDERPSGLRRLWPRTDRACADGSRDAAGDDACAIC